MKKVLIPFLVAGMLGATSCTEVFEPTVDYGDQTYINDYSALVSAVNDLNKSISERFEALNTLLNKNLVDIKLSIDANTGAIKVLEESMADGLSTINTTLLNGFSALSTQIDETGKQIVYAMNENGELLRLQIDETGKLISAQIETSSKELKEALVTAINSQTTALEEKFDALNGLIKGGFADVTAKIGEVGDALELSIKGLDTTLGEINTTMTEGFTTLGTKIDANGNTIATAINEQGDILEAAIEANGTVISAGIKNFKDAYDTAEAANLSKMAELVTAINNLTAANNENSANLVTKLEQLLSDNGIYYDENDKTQMYMTPENFATIQDAGTNSNMYKLYADQLTTLPVAFTSKQVVDATGATHAHAVFTPNTAADAAPVLVASKAAIVDGVANGKQVVRVVKTAVNRNYTVTITSGCALRNMFAMRLTDANGKNDFTFASTQSHSFKLIVYNASTSVIQNNINAIVYCCSTGTSDTYPLVDPK